MLKKRQVKPGMLKKRQEKPHLRIAMYTLAE
jgi:hypothetical protein